MTRRSIAALLLCLGPALRAAEAPAPAPSEGLDVTIKGDFRDEVPFSKPPPTVDVSFDHVATLSREGQTDRVLTGPMDHLTGQEQLGFIPVESRQTFLARPAKIPAPPFVRMEIAPGLAPAKWEFQVVDQDDKALKVSEGTLLPKFVAEWDGFLDGAFKLRPGPAYTPVLVLTDERRRVQRYFGEPVHFAAMQYVQGGLLHVELDNNRLFERGRATFSEDMTPILAASLNVLRQHIGKPLRVTLHAPPAGAQTQKRLESLKAFYKEGLNLEEDQMTFAVEPMGARGDVTEITVKSNE